MFAPPPEPTSSERRVLELARHIFSAEDKTHHLYLLYLRVLCDWPTFLRQDPARSPEDDGRPLVIVTQSGVVVVENVPSAADRPGAQDDDDDYDDDDGFENLPPLSPRDVEVRHPELPRSACRFDPARDVLWFAHDTDAGEVAGMAPYYGSQLSAVRNVLFAESRWRRDVDACLAVLGHFPGVMAVYVLLGDYRSPHGVVAGTEGQFRATAEKLAERDEHILRGRGVAVEYIDYQSNVHGGFRASKKVVLVHR
ncbi:hypothetical protein V2A60_002284 [Cordyceps javanica]|uniref:Uncharacterized protein n=1 Tax=Cordyceps javanica TaxID=43265 RepID=A0A545VHU3_9HYPO|nr:hypothetical protein IF1G_01208 [Cordyceps javanica]TQW12428.1 hypothetical protein IF2G_01159 [Cordyceps javanica]